MALLNVKQNEDKILGELVLKTDNVLGVSCHHDQILLTHTNKISLLQLGTCRVVQEWWGGGEIMCVAVVSNSHVYCVVEGGWVVARWRLGEVRSSGKHFKLLRRVVRLLVVGGVLLLVLEGGDVVVWKAEKKIIKEALKNNNNNNNNNDNSTFIKDILIADKNNDDKNGDDVEVVLEAHVVKWSGKDCVVVVCCKQGQTHNKAYYIDNSDKHINIIHHSTAPLHTTPNTLCLPLTPTQALIAALPTTTHLTNLHTPSHCPLQHFEYSTQHQGTPLQLTQQDEERVLLLTTNGVYVLELCLFQSSSLLTLPQEFSEALNKYHHHHLQLLLQEESESEFIKELRVFNKQISLSPSSSSPLLPSLLSPPSSQQPPSPQQPPSSSSPQAAYHVHMGVLERVVKGQWSHEAFLSLSLPSVVQAEVMEAVMKKQQHTLLSKLLCRHANTLTPHVVVKLLCHLLNSSVTFTSPSRSSLLRSVLKACSTKPHHLSTSLPFPLANVLVKFVCRELLGAQTYSYHGVEEGDVVEDGGAVKENGDVIENSDVINNGEVLDGGGDLMGNDGDIMEDGDDSMDGEMLEREYEGRLLEWAGLLFDSFHSHIILHHNHHFSILHHHLTNMCSLQEVSAFRKVMGGMKERTGIEGRKSGGVVGINKRKRVYTEEMVL